ncbi:hypothetical protein B2J88_48245 [Rhodococcus sp. SRB_17]|nr:hypothetical protein [Rhodococcus sp. SRB_17]
MRGGATSPGRPPRTAITPQFAAELSATPSKENPLVLILPLSLEFDVHTTGSAAIDGLGRLSVLLYDLLGDFGSATINAGS